MDRKAYIKRETKETQIELSINLDGTGKYKVDTQVGFLSHMLESFSFHSMIDLEVMATG
ncbi:MAG: imidazoleglycerol-phosphate dehydratase, partial [Hydrogenothermaceae bacterium]